MSAALAVTPMMAMAQDADPCPQIIQDSQSAPDDLARVQSDIERYTLCVQRAVLLQRLNDVAQAGAEQVSPSFNIDNIEGLPYSRDDIEEMIANLQEREAKAAELIEAAVKQQETGVSVEGAVGEIAAAKSKDTYKISEVFGSGGGLSARLVDNEGNPVTVKVGDQLPDGSTVVVVRINSVAVVKDEKQQVLEWDAPGG